MVAVDNSGFSDSVPSRDYREILRVSQRQARIACLWFNQLGGGVPQFLDDGIRPLRARVPQI
jgi:hypothetical protein